MKKTIFCILLFFTSLSLVQAQTDARAKSILSQVSKKYRSYDIIKADFTVTANSTQANIVDSQSGTLYVQSKTNKYKVVLEDQELISNGALRWTYLKDDKEVQLSTANNAADALNPAKIFTIYEKGYKYLYNGETRANGRVYDEIELTPEDSKNSFFKIKLKIDKQTRLIDNAVIFDKNGNRYTYKIKSFAPLSKVSDTFFTFDTKKHPGVEVVDLR